MTEIWVPYGPLEVSFDIRQENLSQILEPAPQKLLPEEIDVAADKIEQENLVLLSGTAGTQKFVDVLLTRNKNLKKIIYPKPLGAFARRKAQEFSIQAEQLSAVESPSEAGQQKSVVEFFPFLNAPKTLLVSSIHYDPFFGLSSSASELVRQSTDLKRQMFSEFSDALPISPGDQRAAEYAINLLQTIPGLAALELVEKAGTGLVGISHGEVSSAHSKSEEIWRNNLSIPTQKADKVIFGCGGGDNDRNLTDSFGRALFPILTNVAIADSAKICMLAECGNGLGSEAFLRFVTGRLEPRAKIGGVQYVEGLEVLTAFQKLQEDFDLNILTTLPKYYASKFGLKTITGARQAPASLLQQGSRAKILVIPDASSTSFRS
jgi:hypothetical protein